MKKLIKTIFRKIISSGLEEFKNEFKYTNQTIAILNAKNLFEKYRLKENIKSINDIEFKVFSQWGQDGIIQYLINKLDIKSNTFIEFGVGNYTESNTRYLLMNDNWKGLIIEQNKKDVEYIKNDNIYWQYDISILNSKINKDNINDLISSKFANKEIGLLSIDIDGNDYWVWKSIEYKPCIVICEYNSLLGNTDKLTVPYDESFSRYKYSYSGLFYGASLQALISLGKEKGYVFIGCNKNASDAFFIRKDLYLKSNLNFIGEYILATSKDSRDINGNLKFLEDQDRMNVIADIPFYSIDNNKLVTLNDLK